MHNLRKDYPSLFKIKEVIFVPKQQSITKWRDNTPTIKEFATHYEVRKQEHSSPIILSNKYIF